MICKKKLAVGVVCLLALVTMSCNTTKEVQDKGKALKTAIAFYKAIEDPTPATEQVMELTDYRMYGYPALLYGNLGIRWGVEKLQGASEDYQVEIPFWCHGTNPAKAAVKLRRKLLVQVAPDPASEGGWRVTRFKFQGDEELGFIRQYLTWIVWMFAAPMAFFQIITFFFRRSIVAYFVASLMGLPIQLYVTYLCFGTAWRTAAAMLAWMVFQSWLANKQRQA